MKKIVFVIASLINWILLLSQTVIPAGDVSGNWLINDSPYLIEGEIIIPNGETLIIDPGVIVEFQGHYKFNVQGKLIAIGNQQDLIKFTVSDTTGYYNNSHTGWHGLRFNNTPATNDSSKVKYCQFEFGKAIGDFQIDNFGGALFVLGFNKISLSNCMFTNNYAAERGGGIYSSSNLFTYNLIISENNAVYWGGGIYIGSSFSLSNSLITNNWANHGGGISCYGNDLDLVNLTISNNFAEDSGGGIFSNAYYTDITNLICWNNYPEQIRGARGPAQATGFLTIEYSCIEGGVYDLELSGMMLYWLDGNLDENPLFHENGDYPYSLSFESPCIDVGTFDIAGFNLPEFDLAGNQRIYGDEIDMGAYEWQGTGAENNELPITNFLLKNYPNPFNPSTTIEFSIQNIFNVEITIFNTKGQIIKTLIHNEFAKGNYSVIWNGNDEFEKPVSSGIYYYKLNINGKTKAVRKCLLLK